MSTSAVSSSLVQIQNKIILRCHQVKVMTRNMIVVHDNSEMIKNQDTNSTTDDGNTNGNKSYSSSTKTTDNTTGNDK